MGRLLAAAAAWPGAAGRFLGQVAGVTSRWCAVLQPHVQAAEETGGGDLATVAWCRGSLRADELHSHAGARATKAELTVHQRLSTAAQSWMAPGAFAVAMTVGPGLTRYATLLRAVV